MTTAGSDTRPREGLGISVRGLTKTFGSLRAVDDLTFDVRAGRVTGFLGPNGAGKTTTLRMLLGLVRPTAGEAVIGGERLRLHAAVAVPREQHAEPGTVLAAGRDGIDVACGEGSLRVRVLQRDGGKAITAADYLNGRRDLVIGG